MQPPKALFFDVFGTLVDWRSSIAREAQAILSPLGHDMDWLAFADAWRSEYQPAMEEIRSGRQSFCKLDILHRRNLEKILPPSKSAVYPARSSQISTPPGTGSMAGRIRHPDSRASNAGSCSRRCRMEISP